MKVRRERTEDESWAMQKENLKERKRENEEGERKYVKGENSKRVTNKTQRIAKEKRESESEMKKKKIKWMLRDVERRCEREED